MYKYYLSIFKKLKKLDYQSKTNLTIFQRTNKGQTKDKMNNRYNELSEELQKSVDALINTLASHRDCEIDTECQSILRDTVDDIRNEYYIKHSPKKIRRKAMIKKIAKQSVNNTYNV